MAAYDPAWFAGIHGRRCHACNTEVAALESELSVSLDADHAFSRRSCVTRTGASEANVYVIVAAGPVAAFAGYLRRLLRMVSARAAIDTARPANAMIVINVVTSITSHLYLTCAIYCGIFGMRRRCISRPLSGIP